MLTQYDVKNLGEHITGMTAFKWNSPQGEREIRASYRKFQNELNNYQPGNTNTFNLLLQGIWNVVFQWDNTRKGGPDMDTNIRQLYSDTFNAIINCMKVCKTSAHLYEQNISNAILFNGTLYRILCDINASDVIYSDKYYSYSFNPHIPEYEGYECYCGVIATTNTQPGINIAGVYQVYSELQHQTYSCREYEHEVIFPMKREDIQQLIEFNDAQLLNGDWTKGGKNGKT